MRLRDHELPLDPDVERELEAVDHALRGLRVEPGLEDLRDLAVDVRADRPAPPADFAARLDEWAAAGFPREGRPSDGGERESGPALGSLRERLRTFPPRRLILSAGAAATLVVAVAVGIGVSDQLGGSDGSPGGIVAQSTPSSTGSGVGDAAKGSQRDTSRGGAETRARLGVGYAARNQARSGAAGSGLFERAVPLASGRPAHRKVARNADLVLSTEPQDVRHVADEVVGVVDKYNGFVVSSNVTSGRAPEPRPAQDPGAKSMEQGSGSFNLRIPAQHLQAALGDMSKLAHVTSRTEGVQDITKRFDSAKAHVGDLEAVRTSLLRQLGDALTIEEQDSIKAQLRIVENELADAKDRLGHVQQRIHLVPVTVEIRGQAGVDAGGGWGIGDAFRDAGRVLTVIAGILLISAAVLVPLGLLGAVAWLTARAVVRRRREDALE